MIMTEGEVESNDYSQIVEARVKKLANQDSNSSFTFTAGPEDTSTIIYGENGSFIKQVKSVTITAKQSFGEFDNLHLWWISLLILIVIVVIASLIVSCVWLKYKHQRTKRKRNKSTRISSHINGFIVDHHIPSSEMFQQKYTAPAQSYSTQKLYQWCQEREMQHYKSLWAVNTSSPSPSTVHISDRQEIPNAYKTRSLPSKHKQRPFSSIEDLNEYYSKVNFSKKMKNRMTNDEAAIIASQLCRSSTKSQNFSGGSNSNARGDDAIVIYDERTAL